MRIAVFGATGMVGGAVVEEILSRGDEVHAVSRSIDARTARDRLTVGAVDVDDAAGVTSVLAGVDAAVLTVRLPAGQESRLAPITARFLDAAAETGVRVLVLGGAGALRSPTDAGRLLVDDPMYIPEQWRTIALAGVEQLRACQAHSFADWVYLSPPAELHPGDRVGGYRRGGSTLLVDDEGRSAVSAADLAIAVVDELERPGADTHFTVIAADEL
ncbi:MAG: NAD(P)H-binding protein [Gordonia sp. (in: high G+C Gram-positive bacteria)]